MNEVGLVSSAPASIAARDWLDIPDHLLDSLPVGVYFCDRDGAIVRHNQAATELWGRASWGPDQRYCGSYRLRSVDGYTIPHTECPMADALQTGQACRGQEIVIERPDGSTIVALVDINVIRDEAGSVIGAVNVFRDHTEQRRRRMRLVELESRLEAQLQALPAAIYTTDAVGRITFYNEAAVQLWGARPELGASEFCGSRKLCRPDGTSLPHDESPMAVALKERRVIRGMEAAAERPDGTRIPFLAYPTPLFDDAGALVGAVNMLVDISEQKAADLAAHRLAAIVESSEDAILAKNLDGIITSWNNGAERLFGYRAEEAIGKSVTMLIPPERHDEEPAILSRIRRGQRVEPYETVRRRKDGSLIDIRLTVSPVRDGHGVIVGASKIAHDISDRKRAEEKLRLLLREMNHRIKNLFALSSSVVRLSGRGAATPQDAVTAAQERLSALARAHALTVSDGAEAAALPASLHALIYAIIAPYQHADGEARVSLRGPDLDIDSEVLTTLALLLHELATNAAKYGALSSNCGSIDVQSTIDGDSLQLDWSEKGDSQPAGRPGDALSDGFGSQLIRTAVQQLGGEFSREWQAQGLAIRLVIPLAALRANRA